MAVHAAIFVVTAFAFGCGDGLEIARVKGKVIYQGKPLTHGTVVFTPLDGTRGPQAIGAIKDDGTFEMMTIDRAGAALGEHKVTVHCRAKLTEAEAKALMVGKLLIPTAYATEAETPLRFDVKRGVNECPLELKD